MDKQDNPWCDACQEEHCIVSLDGTCAMVRVYLRAKRKETRNELENDSKTTALHTKGNTMDTPNNNTSDESNKTNGARRIADKKNVESAKPEKHKEWRSEYIRLNNRYMQMDAAENAAKNRYGY